LKIFFSPNIRQRNNEAKNTNKLTNVTINNTLIYTARNDSKAAIPGIQHNRPQLNSHTAHTVIQSYSYVKLEIARYTSFSG